MQGFTKKIIIICLLASFYICGCGRTDIANMKKEKDVASESLNAKNEFKLFSRELSEDECYELAVFKYQYEKDGRAPAKEIVKVEKKGEVDTDLLCICLEDNIIYIPERLLEDEEFLQIIDYMEKKIMHILIL